MCVKIRYYDYPFNTPAENAVYKRLTECRISSHRIQRQEDICRLLYVSYRVSGMTT
ncbi:conserved domain protein [Ruminococcus albus 8]|uniref:Conserved domain protein n=1 Tax=Ruminococcus albus 8 TaxID=246199 RepID=E9SH29_RUMAL|nr:conserved domain protein [Ruminococcus albus 8]